MRTPEEHFWENVEKTDTCWLWTAGTIRGYGQFRIGKRKMLAHRFSMALFSGPIPLGMVVDHICHVPACVNPDHLRVVTNKENCENRAGAPRNSKSGIRGVSWRKDARKWKAQVKHNGEVLYFGLYENIEDAEAAAVAARRALFTHSDMDAYDGGYKNHATVERWLDGPDE